MNDAEFRALAISQPADARRQTLKPHALLRQRDPPAQDFVVREHFEHKLVRAMDIGWLAGQRGPAKGTAAFAEKRTDVCRHEAGKIVGVFHALLKGERADVVAVIERD